MDETICLTVHGQSQKSANLAWNDDHLLAYHVSRRIVFDPSLLISFRIGSNGTVLAVSDAGGGWGDTNMTGVVIRGFRSHLENLHEEANPTSLGAVIESVNESTYEESCRRVAGNVCAGLTTVWFHETSAYIAHVGDSRAYLMRGDTLFQLTEDHTLVTQLVRAGLVAPEEVGTHEYRNVLLQAVGSAPTILVELGKLDLRQGDRILLCTDGLWENLTNKEIDEAMRTFPVLTGAVTRLVGLAHVRGRDNVTVLMAEATGDALPLLNPAESPRDTYTVLARGNPDLLASS